MAKLRMPTWEKWDDTQIVVGCCVMISLGIGLWYALPGVTGAIGRVAGGESYMRYQCSRLAGSAHPWDVAKKLGVPRNGARDFCNYYMNSVVKKN